MSQFSKIVIKNSSHKEDQTSFTFYHSFGCCRHSNVEGSALSRFHSGVVKRGDIIGVTGFPGW